MDEKNLIKLIKIIELEDSVTANLKQMDVSVKQITFTDVTREFRKDHPDLLQYIRDFIKLKKEKQI